MVHEKKTSYPVQRNPLLTDLVHETVNWPVDFAYSKTSELVKILNMLLNPA